jgi:hypothetical protein
MPNVLRTAIAYRSDFHGREDWTNARKEPIPVSCPNACAIEYDLVVPEGSSGEDVLKWVEALLERLENDHPGHANVVRL